MDKLVKIVNVEPCMYWYMVYHIKINTRQYNIYLSKAINVEHTSMSILLILVAPYNSWYILNKSCVGIYL
jgi:hypothetical protein